jgi:hypothetical protein
VIGEGKQRFSINFHLGLPPITDYQSPITGHLKLIDHLHRLKSKDSIKFYGPLQSLDR